MHRILKQPRHSSKGYEVLFSERLTCNLLRLRKFFTRSAQLLRYRDNLHTHNVLYPKNEIALQKLLWRHNCPYLKLKVWQYSTYNKDSATIFALSTAPGRAAIAIIRLSGSACLQIYRALCPDALPLKPRSASLRTLLEPQNSSSYGQILDPSALVLYFPGPRTVTGEDVLEFHVHGGPAIVKAVLSAIPEAVPLIQNSPAVRYAEPGEFTRRAFYNDRLDLTQIEALGDTLSAETEQQRRLAIRGTSNSLAQRYESWRLQLLHARGELEALIDFSEDQHFDDSPVTLIASVAKQVNHIKNHIEASILNASRGELLRNGINIALLGSPNAGKSSLLNRIVGREAAIVSAEAGTTRDVVEINVDIGGFFCKFGDLAGIRRLSTENSETPDLQAANSIGEVEKEGIRRAKARVATADVIILVLSIELDEDKNIKATISPNILEALATFDAERQQLITVINKSDLVPNGPATSPTSGLQSHFETVHLMGILKPFNPGPLHFISCKEDPGGIPSFLSNLVQLFHRFTSPVNIQVESKNIPSSDHYSIQLPAESLGASERQRLLLADCKEHLSAFMDSIPSRHVERVSLANDDSEDVDIILAAESLRAAGECLAKITGKGEAGDVEEVLGVVFEKFCVGK